MKIFLLSFVTSLLSLTVIDAIWFKLIAKNFYTKHIGHLMADNVNLMPVVLFYPIYAIALSLLVIIPTVSLGGSLGKAFGLGALLGLAAYSAYDLTNHATLKGWPLSVTVIDILWGMFITGSVAAIAVFVIKHFS